MSTTSHELSDLSRARSAMARRRAAIEAALSHWDHDRAADAVVAMVNADHVDRETLLTTSFWLERVFDQCTESHPEISIRFDRVRALLARHTSIISESKEYPSETIQAIQSKLVFECIAAFEAS